MEEQKDFLQNIEDEMVRPASVGLRFANYIIDLIVYYVVSILISFLLVPFTPWFVAFSRNNTANYAFFLLALAMFIYWLYYFLMEGFTNGKTVGKMITGTKAVSIDGLPITWKSAAVRSIIRFVPFEPFSALGGFPWHDYWPHTIVVKEKNNLANK